MKILLLGVNGISMQGIVAIMQQQGHEVFGYDDNPQKLSFINYTSKIPQDTQLIVYSSAIKKTHPLLQRARQNNIQTIQRTDFFVKYMPLNSIKILVAGAHGKTTTSGILACLLNSSYYLGGIIQNTQSSAKFDKNSKYIVIETDESDSSFLKWKGQYKILLNFDYEHMIHYKTQHNIQNAYTQFIMNDLETTKIILNQETKAQLKIPAHPNIITYGTQNADFIIRNITATTEGITFYLNNEEIKLPVLGIHNAYNFSAIYAVLTLLNKKTTIQKIAKFPGIKKRMQPIHWPKHTKKFFLDYGHHPTEIGSVLNSLKQHFNEEFIVIFEPHKPSRILDTLTQWPKIFKDYTLYLYPIFSADELELNENQLHFSTEKFYEFLKQHNVNVFLLKENLSNLPINHKNLICFSAGRLCSKLDI